MKESEKKAKKTNVKLGKIGKNKETIEHLSFEGKSLSR